VARWVCGAKWAEGPAPQAQCATPLGLTLSEGLGRNLRTAGDANLFVCQCAVRGAYVLDRVLQRPEFGSLQDTLTLPRPKCHGMSNRMVGKMELQNDAQSGLRRAERLRRLLKLSRCEKRPPKAVRRGLELDC
jgi:hypothetical protein